MKKLILIFIVTLVGVQNVIAQESNFEPRQPKLWQELDTNVKVNKLIRNWELAYKTSDTLTYFSGDIIIKRPWNQANYMKILFNDQIEEGYFAGCGNDTEIYNNKGQWSFDPIKMEFNTTIPIYSIGMKFQILSMSTKVLILKKLH